MKSTFKNKKFKAIPSIIPSTIFECEIGRASCRERV